MSTTVKKLYPRSPRYTLNIDEKRVLRFSGLPKGSKDFFTEILNLSETGMAFTLPYLDNPKMDEEIKIQFTPPGGKQIACFAKVKRIEHQNFKDDFGTNITKKVVGVFFINIHPEHIKSLNTILGKKFSQIHEQVLYERKINLLKSIFHDPFSLGVALLLGFALLISPWLF